MWNLHPLKIISDLSSHMLAALSISYGVDLPLGIHAFRSFSPPFPKLRTQAALISNFVIRVPPIHRVLEQ